MKIIESPIVHHVAQTELDQEGIDAFLLYFGVEDWNTDAPSGTEELIEVAGRMCYSSFETKTHSASEFNKNVTKVRKGNTSYINNIHNVKHGSILEHGTDSYIISDVPRLYCHEQVRHRVGVAYSERSLRYIRLNELDLCFPHPFQQLDDKTKKQIKELFMTTAQSLENTYNQMEEILFPEGKRISFEEKKRLTSAMRYLMPMGMATGIMVTANHRSWRHIIQLRTSRHAEDWIRAVYVLIAEDLEKRYPNLYQDMKGTSVNGMMEYTF